MDWVEKGVALLTVLLLLIAMSVLGIGALTVSALGNRMAGFARGGETGATAAESCIGTALRIIQDTLDQGALPSAYLDTAVPTPGPVPASNGPTLQQEILGQADNSPDVATIAPNTLVTVNNFIVRGDIDRLYAAPRVGSALQFASGYEGTAGGAAAGGVDVLYRIDCTATQASTAAMSRITAVYACMVSGETCQRKP